MTTMRVRGTHYITADENDPRWTGEKNYPLYSSDGQLIANVKRDFAQDLFTEGAGWIGDGRLVNTAGRCSFGEPLRGTPQQEPTQQCWHIVDQSIAPWGYGSHTPLFPLVTIATDQRLIPNGTRVYIREFDGVQIPTIHTRVGPLGGFRHNGVFIAGDTGSAIRGSHIDIFMGTRAMMNAVARLIPSDYVTITFTGGTGRRSIASSSSGSGGALFVILGVAFLLTRR